MGHFMEKVLTHTGMAMYICTVYQNIWAISWRQC